MMCLKVKRFFSQKYNKFQNDIKAVFNRFLCMDTILHLKSTTSTNDEMSLLVKQYGDDVPEGMLIYTDEQTNGRGQIGNHWESETGKNLLCTVLLYPDFLPADQQFIITQLGALSVADFLKKYVGLTDISIKWPNDVYWKDYKISGTLNEAMLMGKSISHVMLGVGVNLNQLVFTDYAPNPISAIQITHKEYPIDQAAVIFRQCLMNRYIQLVNGDISSIRGDYMSALYRREGYYKYEDESGNCFEASILDVHPTGELDLKLKDGKIRSFLFKQVRFVL